MRSHIPPARAGAGAISSVLTPTAASFDELAISFNGGKDCLVLLLLFLSSLGTPTIAPTSTVQSVYVMSSHPFAEVDDFVDACVRAYALDLHRYALPMRSAFATYLREHPKIKAVFVGTRRTDPHGEFLGHFDRTDHGWPDFMRVQPVIDWHYQEVWAVSVFFLAREVWMATRAPG